MVMRNISWDFSSNADKLVALLLVVTVLAVLV
jgi:uncharacterized membrane protein